MQYDYLLIYNDFFTKKISYQTFREQIFDYINTSNDERLFTFFNNTTDDNFSGYDEDMVMLTYLTIWIYPNKLNAKYKIESSDNMYLFFIKSVLDMYNSQNSFEIVDNGFNYEIVKRNGFYLIINPNESDIVIPLPDILKNKEIYCLNCGENKQFKETLELYPYGFYLLDLEAE